MKRASFCAAAVLAAAGANAQIRVTKTAYQKAVLDMSALSTAGDTASRAFATTLRRDLESSGWFRISSQGAEVRLQGSVRQSGGKVSASVRAVKVMENRQVLGKAYSASPQSVQQLAHKVADEIVAAVTGKPGIASSKIALVGSRDGKKEIYTCDYDGTNLRQLTRDGKLSLAPNWGPKGRMLTYTSYLRGFPDCYMIDMQTRRRTLIAAYGGLNATASISPDGRQVALVLSKDGNPELYLKDLKSGRLTRLTKTRAVEASPSWSPDGKQLVYVSDTSGRPQLYVISKDGGRPRRLTSRGTQNVAPDWGPNGWIAFTTREGGRFRPAIINPQTREARVLESDWADYEDLSWAPDGRHIVCTRIERYRSSLYRLDTLNDPPVALKLGAGDWFSPSWSP
ncbi:DPP IV N-terminal domain-containing protein [Verrucomicrobiota bacterium]